MTYERREPTEFTNTLDLVKGERGLNNKNHMAKMTTKLHSYDNGNDQFIEVQSHKVAKYFLSDIDKTSTYAEIVLYLKQKGVHTTAIKIYQSW